jgi:hypothetical protein
VSESAALVLRKLRLWALNNQLALVSHQNLPRYFVGLKTNTVNNCKDRKAIAAYLSVGDVLGS